MKNKNYAPQAEKINFLLIVLLLTLLTTTTFNISVFAQEAASIVETTIPRNEQTESGKKENILEEFFSGNPSNNLITATSYAFSVQNGVALEDMSSGTTQLVGPSLDDTASAVTNIGFDFWYDGARFTQFSVNANGLARLGATAVLTSFDNASIFATTTNAPKIAPFFEDLCTGSNGNIRFKVVGSAPDRKLVVEWNNMQITRGAGCAGVGGGTFQMWLYESAAATNPGVIQFVYGNGIVASAGVDGGASIGLQSGAATNFASVTASTDTVSYATADNLNAAGIATGKSYIFTPNVPTAPSVLNFTAIAPTSQTLNWTDNSGNEFGFVIYRSTDNVNFTFVGQTAANATNFNDAGLTPSTNYFYRVYAVTEGALSAVLSGSQMTAAPGDDTCAGAGGNWSDTATWTDGSIPTNTDNVTIAAGCTVTVDITTAVALNVTIDNGGTLQSPLAGAVITNNLTVSGNVTNNGTLDFSTNGDTSATILTFGAGGANVTFGGTGATTDVRAIIVAKGAQATVVELNTTNFTVRGVATDVAGFLTPTSGTFKVSGTFNITNRVFTATAYTIPATAGFWLNNPNFTVAGQNGSPTNSGLLRIANGIFNIGTATGNSMGFAIGSNTIVEGGSVNATGRFGVSAATNTITYNQSAGTVTVQTIGNASTTLAGFDLGTSVTSNISLTGGTIVVQLANTAVSGPRDYRHQAGSGITGVTGGTLQLGNASSGAAKLFTMRGVVPNLLLTNTSANHSAQWDITLVNYNNISLSITVSGGATLNFGNVVFLFAGPVLTNNGTLVHNGASSNFVTFNAAVPVSYTGSGTVTAPLSNLSLQSDLGFTVDPASSNIVATNIRVFTGNITNANKLTLGNGGATASAVQFGNTTTPTAAGVLDVPFTFNLGTGGETISYLRTTASRVTGGEINPARTLTAMTYDDNDTTHTLTVAGGNLTVTGTLTLTNGVIFTGANTLIHNGTVARTLGFVDGILSRSFTATGAYTYHVGQNEYSPVAANITALGTNPSSLSIQAFDATLSGFDPTKSVSRNWDLNETGNLTASLDFQYRDSDVNGNEADYRVYRRETSGTPTNLCPGAPCVNTGTNTASVTGISDFSRWTVAEAFATTAASVSIGGRVIDTSGRGISRARIYITDLQGNVVVRQTNPFGYYRFSDIAVGETYVLTVEHKSYLFNQPTRTISINEENFGINFIATGRNPNNSDIPSEEPEK